MSLSNSPTNSSTAPAGCEMTTPLPDFAAAMTCETQDAELFVPGKVREFDPICQLAAEIMGTPIALVTVVGKEHQLIKGSVGTDLQQTPLRDSFCAVAISRSTASNPMPLIIEDARLDPDFASKGVVTGPPNIRFYAGVPYYDPTGQPLGALCVIDTRPRQPSPQQVNQLRLLARQVGNLVLLRQTMREREQAWSKLHLLMDNLGDHAILLLDAQGRIQNWTVGLKSLFGYDPAEVVGKHFGLLFKPRDRATDLPAEELAQARRAGKTDGINQRIRKDGTHIWVEYKTSRILNAQGELVGYAQISTDITRRIESERRLIEKRNRLQAITECSSSGIFELSPDGEIIRANSVARELLGLATVEGKAYDAPEFKQERLDGTPLPVEEMPFSLVSKSNQQVRDRVFAVRLPDGTRRVISVSGAPVRDSNEQVAGYIFNATDITTQTEMLQQLRQSEEQLKLTLAATEDGMWDWHIQTGVMHTSERWHTMLGYPPAPVVGVSQFDELLHPDDKALVHRALDHHFTGQTSQFQAETRLRRADGTYAFIRCRGKVSHRDKSGKPLRMVGTHQDITAERQAEDELQRAKEAAMDMLREIASSRERLQLALDGTGMGLWDMDLRAGQLFLSPQCLYILGYEQAEFDSTPNAWIQLIHPADQVLLENATRLHLEQATEFLEAEYRVRHKNGSYVWIHTRGRVLVRDEAGKPLRMSGTHQDVTQRVLAEQESMDMMLRLRRIAAEIPGVVYEFTHAPDGTCTLNYVSEGVRTVLGFGPDEPVDFQTILGKIHPADAEPLKQAIQTSAKHLCPLAKEFRVQLDGKQRWLRTQGSPKRNADGSVSFHGFTTDITEQQEMIDRTARMNAMLIGQQEASIDGILVVNEKQKVVSVNKRFFEIWQIPDQTDLTEDESYLKQAVESRVCNPEDFFEKVTFLYDNPEIKSRDEICLKDGRTLDRYSAPLYTNQGEYVGRIWYFRDITQTKDAQEQLARARDEARAASAAKSQFLANTSHELRTPMTAILGFTDLLTDESATPEQRADYIATIKRNGEHLLSLINDVLDLSKIEAGKLQCEAIDTDPILLLNDILDLLNVRAKCKGISLRLRQTTDLPRVIKTDPTRLRQVLVNLIGNAIKFTEVGGVQVRVGFDPQTKIIRFEVADSGIGMSPEQCRRIFLPFMQADTSTTRKFGGTGLGLAISVRLAKLLGGEITLRSTPGQGSTFTLLLDLQNQDITIGSRLSTAEPTETPKPASLPPQLLTGKRVLLVEDGPDNQRLIGHHLKKLGAEYQIAGNGRLGVDAVEAAVAQARPFDVILMDMQMPVMDGYEAATLLRDKGITTPIVALTAHAMSGDRQKCLNAGCTQYMTKPIQPRELAALLHQLTHQPEHAAA